MFDSTWRTTLLAVAACITTTRVLDSKWRALLLQHACITTMSFLDSFICSREVSASDAQQGGVRAARLVVRSVGAFGMRCLRVRYVCILCTGAKGLLLYGFRTLEQQG